MTDMYSGYTSEHSNRKLFDVLGARHTVDEGAEEAQRIRAIR